MERENVLKSFFKAAKDDKTQVRETTMRRDLTQTERVTEKALHQELKEKKQHAMESGDGRAKWTIRRGKVVNVGEYREVRE